MRELASIAYYSLKQNIRNRIFLVLIGAGVFLIVLSILIGEMEATQQQRFILDFSLGVTQLIAVMLAIIIGSYQMREELDKGVLSLIITKPVSRSRYLLGKFLGGTLSIAVTILGLLLISLVVFWFQAVHISGLLFTSHYLFLCEAMLVLAIAMFFSLISSSLVATMASLGITIAGHFSHDFYLLSQKGSGVPGLFGKIIYTILPNLEKFNIKSFVLYSTSPGAGYAAIATLYAFFFLMILFLISTRVFSRRDIH